MYLYSKCVFTYKTFTSRYNKKYIYNTLNQHHYNISKIQSQHSINLVLNNLVTIISFSNYSYTCIMNEKKKTNLLSQLGKNKKKLNSNEKKLTMKRLGK